MSYPIIFYLLNKSFIYFPFKTLERSLVKELYVSSNYASRQQSEECQSWSQTQCQNYRYYLKHWINVIYTAGFVVSPPHSIPASSFQENSYVTISITLLVITGRCEFRTQKFHNWLTASNSPCTSVICINISSLFAMLLYSNNYV